jgi:low temperature requirement protein LtrA
MDLDWLQWPAMAVTILASWLVASSHRTRRRIGFWVFLFSNVLWITWGLPAQAYALVVLQVALAAMNIRGARKNDDAHAAGQARQPQAG